MTIQGQMLENTERGKLLMDTIKKYQPKTVVEIGTWKGLGSTKCILDSMSNDCYFVSLESNLSFFNIAKNNLINYENKIRLLYGTIVNETDIINFVSNKILTNEQKIWVNEDIENVKKCPNVFSEIPLEIDLLLLDGGEFSTYSEWLILKDRTKIVCLDDTGELKTKQIYDELLHDDHYILLEDTQDGNGFCVFIKK